MSRRKIRPYIPYTLGILPNPFVTYVFDTDEKRVSKQPDFFGVFKMGDPSHISLANPDIIPRQSGMQSLIGLGDVEIATANGTKRFRHIKFKKFNMASSANHQDASCCGCGHDKKSVKAVEKKRALLEGGNIDLHVTSQEQGVNNTTAEAGLTQEMVARAWLAYKELAKKNLVSLNPASKTHKLMFVYGGTNLQKWIEENPHNLILGFRTGMDFMQDFSCILPETFLHRLAYKTATINQDEYDRIRNGSVSLKDVTDDVFYKMFSKEQEQSALKLLQVTMHARAQELATE